MKKLFPLACMLILCCALFAQPSIQLNDFATGFDDPLDIVNCGDERLFVVEQKGKIWILDANGNKLPTPFLDIGSMLSTFGEQGLLGLAFHPDYLNNGYFYVNFTRPDGDSRVSRFSVSDTDPNVADPDSEVVLLDVPQPFWNHNGGDVSFGPDGYLYISFGDGGSGGDPQNNGQKRTTHLGKMLRIDVDNGSPYAVPDNNPFVNDSQTLDEIWALGLRNVWRFSFDRVTGDMWMGDVGQNEWEEIDFQPATSTGGENYGWRCYEGNHSFETNGCEPMNTMAFPIFEYQNSFSSGDCSVTGGFVYRGCEMPALFGHYIFADYCSGRFWSITPDANSTSGWTGVELANFTDDNFAGFGENSDGELFVAGLKTGKISKVVSTSPILVATHEACEGEGNGAITYAIPTDQLIEATWNDGSTEITRSNLSPGMYSVEINTSNGCVFTEAIEITAGLPYPDQPVVTVGMNGMLSTDATADSYQWYLNGNPIAGATNSIYEAQESGDYSVVVANANGCETASNEVMVTVSVTKEELGLHLAALTPNPFKNTLQLQLRTAGRMDVELVLSDTKGQTLRRDMFNANGFFEKTYDLQDLPAGVYFFYHKK